MKTQYYAAVPNNARGPAFGIGTTHSATMRDARRWIPKNEPLDDHDLQVIEITRNSYLRIKRGHPDSVSPRG